MISRLLSFYKEGTILAFLLYCTTLSLIIFKTPYFYPALEMDVFALIILLVFSLSVWLFLYVLHGLSSADRRRLNTNLNPATIMLLVCMIAYKTSRFQFDLLMKYTAFILLFTLLGGILYQHYSEEIKKLSRIVWLSLLSGIMLVFYPSFILFIISLSSIVFRLFAKQKMVYIMIALFVFGIPLYLYSVYEWIYHDISVISHFFYNDIEFSIAKFNRFYETILSPISIKLVVGVLSFLCAFLYYIYQLVANKKVNLLALTLFILISVGNILLFSHTTNEIWWGTMIATAVLYGYVANTIRYFRFSTIMIILAELVIIVS